MSPRATQAEMEARYSSLVALAHEHGPCSVRHIYYRAVVDQIVTKDDSGYNKVQRAVLHLRREGSIPYWLITDNTRYRISPDVWTGPEAALRHVADSYRRDLWASDVRVEVWVESDSIAGTIQQVTQQWAVPLFVCRGQVSESFAHSAVEEWHHDPDQHRVVLYIGDHDPAGLEIEVNLVEKIRRFNESKVSFDFTRVAVTWDQIAAQDLPGSPPKKEYGFPRAVEAEALPPNDLRELINTEIDRHADPHQLSVLRTAEQSEREIFLRLAAEGVA